MKRLILFAILSGLFAVNGFSQVLAKGNPPLTENVAARMQSVFEFALSREFDASQSKRFRQILIGYWQRNSRADIENCLEYVKVADMIDRLAENQKETARQKLLAAISEAVQKNPNDVMSQLLAEVYNSSQQNVNSNLSGNADSDLSGGNVPSDLVGTWIARRGSGSSYVNPNNGTSSGANASVHRYTFYANGTFEYAILMQSALYQCTTTINGYEAGAFEASDSAIGLVTKKATKSYQDTCRPNLNSNGAAEIPAPKKLFYRFARDEQNNLNLCLSDEAGRSSCFVKQ